MLSGSAQDSGRLVSIEKLAFGGSGIGRVDGKVCFIPFTAPGDRARVEIHAEKKSYSEGTLLECMVPSPARETPACGVFGECGGCCWQHIRYSAQVAAKQQIFVEMLSRSVSVEPGVFLPAVPAPMPYGYRSRVQFKLRSISGKLRFGFYRRGSHYVIDLAGICHIARDGINLIREELCRVLECFPEPDKLPQIDVAAGERSGLLLLFHYIGENRRDIAAWLEEAVPGCAGVTGVFLQCGRKSSLMRVWGDERVAYRVPTAAVEGSPDMELFFRCGGFSQINYDQNRAMIRTVLDWADLKGSERVLDLYCGNGNFSLPLSRSCAEILGVEEYGDSIEDAVFNARINDVRNARFIARDTGGSLRELTARGERFNLVLLDPPRTGAREAAHLIPALDPEKIIYVSCDPATLARDLAIFHGSGYRVGASRPVDMFPQTYHLESVTLLTKV